MLNYINFKLKQDENLLNESFLGVASWQKATKKLLTQIGVDIYIVSTYGTSVTAMFPVVNRLMNTGELHFDQQSIVLLTICALAILAHESYDKITKLKLLIEEKNLSKFLPKIQENLKIITNAFKILCSKTGKAINRFLDIFAYNILLVPFLSVILDIVNEKNLTLENIIPYMVVTAIGALLIFSKSFIEEVWRRFTEKTKIKNQGYQKQDPS